MIEYFPIPILKKDKQYNLYQNEVMNLVSFIKEYHPLPLVNEKAFALVEKQSEILCHSLEHEGTSSYFPMKLNKLLTLLHDAHTFASLRKRLYILLSSDILKEAFIYMQ